MGDLNANTALTLIQALQLVGLVPCLFLIFFLCTLVRRNRQALIPIFYFMALGASFAWPLTDIYLPLANNRTVEAGLLFGESLLVAFSFLLIMQFMMGKVPPPFYWFVLIIPLVGGTSLIYAGMVQAGSACLKEHTCHDVAIYKTLYNIFSSALIFLLLVYYSSRLSVTLKNDADKRHKYWLVISLILLNLFVLAIDLAKLSGRFNPAEADFIVTIFRLSFIYLVITSLFRVFYPNLMGQVIYMQRPEAQHNPDADKPHVDKVRELLEVQRVYREMRLNRAALAEKVGINEHYLSRIINHYFGKNFNELINGYRISEAKQRLLGEPNQQITVIGFEVGFNSIASFNRVFKDTVGKSPTEFRNAAHS